VYDLTQPLPAEPETRPRGTSASRDNGPYALSPSATPSVGTPSPATSRSLEIQPVRAWTGPAEINNLAFSQNGETVGCVTANRLSVLQL
jgi:WD repeat-containing protein 68